MVRKYLIWLGAGVIITLALFLCYLLIGHKRGEPVIHAASSLSGTLTGTIEKKKDGEAIKEAKVPVKGNIKTIYISKGKQVKAETHEIHGVTEIKVNDTEVQVETTFDSDTFEVELPKLYEEEKHNEIGLTFNSDLELVTYYRYSWKYAWVGVEYEVKSKEIKAGVGLCFRF